MSSITSSVGLISGLPTASIIDQLMAIEALPVLRLQVRVSGLEAQRSALSNLLSRLSEIQTSVEGFDDASLFRRYAATSGNSNVLTATAGSAATQGSYTFRVHSLVTHHQLISAGMADRDVTPVGAGTLAIEIGYGKLNSDTALDALNGGSGVRGGVIEITDRSGQSAEVDLTAALTVTDVLEAINTQSGIDVRARVSGDGIIIEDLTGQADENLTVDDVSGGFAALDLGIAGSVANDELVGGDVLNLVEGTPLALLNDGNGIRTNKIGADLQVSIDDITYDISLNGRLDVDGMNSLAVLNNGKGVRLGTIRVTDRTGASADIDLSSAQTVGEVLAALESSGLSLSAIVSGDGTAFQITDNSGGTGALKIEDVTGFAAADLGLAGEYEDDSIVGQSIFRITTIGDVVRAINYAWDQKGISNAGGSKVEASLSDDGNRLVLSSSFPAGSSLEVTALDGSKAAEDLGIEGSVVLGDKGGYQGRSLLAGLNAVLLRSLNGGAGVGLGEISFSNRHGDAPTVIDFAALGVESVLDVLEAINETTDASGIQASINATGNGILIEDLTSGNGSLSISDVGGGTMAADLGIAATATTDSINSGNLQLQYVSEAMLLSDFNHDKGIPEGSFQITARDGTTYTINVTDSQTSVRDLLELINGITDGAVTASINATGDGILLTDTTSGNGNLTVEDLDGGTSAASLRLAGEAEEGAATIDGSFEIHVEIDADDTLDDVVNKLNSAGAEVSASVINDGSGTNPYLLSLTSDVSGLAGEVVFDPGTSGLAMSTLVRPQDAVLFLGSGEGGPTLVVRSSSNTVTDVLPDVTINLVAPSNEPVTLSITQDLDAVVSDVSEFVSNYNAAMDLIDEFSFFDSETLQRGLMFGDATVSRVRDRLYRSVSGEFAGTPAAASRLSEIGVRIVSDARLEFDESDFRDAYAADPQAVETLFSLDETGLGDALEASLNDLTDSIDGVVPGRDDLLGSQVDLLNDRIEDLEALLDIKRIQLEREFLALESALAALQSQQSALTALNGLVTAAITQS